MSKMTPPPSWEDWRFMQEALLDLATRLRSAEDRLTLAEQIARQAETKREEQAGTMRTRLDHMQREIRSLRRGGAA